MRYIADNNGYLLQVSFGAMIECNGRGCVEYTGGVPSGYADLADWFSKEGDKLYRWKIVSSQLTLDSSVPALSTPGAMYAPAGYGLGSQAVHVSDFDAATATGWYSGATGTANKPFGYSLVHTINRNNGGAIIQIGYDMAEKVSSYYSGWTTKSRRKISGEWSPWKYETIKIETLWKNASPTSSFAEQDISVDTSNYSEVIIVAKSSLGQYGYNNMSMARNGENITFVDGSLYRFFSISSNKIHAQCGYDNATPRTDVWIPLRIYGIKGVD